MVLLFLGLVASGCSLSLERRSFEAGLGFVVIPKGVALITRFEIGLTLEAGLGF